MGSVIKVVELSGTFDSSKAKQFRKEINDCLKKGINIVIVDLKNVTFMDSSGLGALVLALKTIQAARGKLLLSSISEPVKMLFELTSMISVFEILSDRAEFKEYANASLA
jgi:anti-anti-sigma factor